LDAGQITSEKKGENVVESSRDLIPQLSGEGKW
jgi:hypothetical protein